MLTHRNVVADTSPLVQFKFADLSSEDTMVSFLPLAHMFERMMEVSPELIIGVARVAALPPPPVLPVPP